jgi:hypothetical protein
MNVSRPILASAAVFAAGFLLLQLAPYGRAHDNPPTVSEPNWDDPRTRELAVRACFDCHSNETRWPWYSNIAPFSWLVQGDVDQGRLHLNFSDWNQSHEDHGHESHDPEVLADAILEDEMPLSRYLLAHPEARLTSAEKEALAAGLQATAAQSPATGAGEEGQEEDAPEHEEGEQAEDEHEIDE